MACSAARTLARRPRGSDVRVSIASDHAGYLLKEALKAFLEGEGHEVLDFGTDSEETVDYPDLCAAAARAVVDGRSERGIVLGGSGQGEQLVANKVRGVRAALCNDLHLAELSRRHNDANVLAIGGRIVAAPLAQEIVRVWLATPFDGGRHARRLEQVAEIERGER
jgi:ribose 5-phosphate isomerase B